MITNPYLYLEIRHNREGTEYLFRTDAATLRRFATDIIARLDEERPPWAAPRPVILCEEVNHNGDLAFLTFEIHRE
jgi:hypothetical protein